ncbi:hypothetical protein DRW41_22415 [Neobacillus piezotolerans]|uniref:Uncharacterized protein n=1 Tax=Neobacillus piezotolerans TaxID=2259171 RepID=A0A3D8GK57_9BACI|nr:hypothetical protein DRW41_22415 [Neobacillus piezotolerans]
MDRKHQVLLFMLGSFLYGGAMYIFHSFIWSIFFLMFISFLITLKISDPKQDFGKQMISASIGIFFFGWVSLLAIIVAKASVVYVFRMLT